MKTKIIIAALLAFAVAITAMCLVLHYYWSIPPIPVLAAAGALAGLTIMPFAVGYFLLKYGTPPIEDRDETPVSSIDPDPAAERRSHIFKSKPLPPAIFERGIWQAPKASSPKPRTSGPIRHFHFDL